MPPARIQLRHPTYQTITQGTVFSCARASRYEGCDVKGLVITARCDVAQRKYPILNYLPIVPLCDWLRRDGLDILTETEQKKQCGNLRRMLYDRNLSPSIIRSVSLEQIAMAHFPTDHGSKAQRKQAHKFCSLAASFRNFSSIKSGEPNALYNWFANERSTDIRDLIKRLSRHSVLGHYFLETLTPNTAQPHGFVCLLREVFTLPRPLAECLGRGLTAEECRTRFGGVSPAGLSFDHQDLAMPLVEIASPTIEHVIQAFSNLFGRIGVPDPVPDDITTIIRRNIPDSRSTQ